MPGRSIVPVRLPGSDALSCSARDKEAPAATPKMKRKKQERQEEVRAGGARDWLLHGAARPEAEGAAGAP